MNRLAVAMFLGIAGVALADEGPVKFHVIVKKDDHVLYSPSFLASVGQPASIRLSDGIAIEALAKPIEADGRAWTQVRITYFETPDSKFVQEMSTHHKMGLRTGTFEYTDPSGRRFVVEIGPSALVR